MDRTDVERWVEAYVRAWDSNAPDDIGALFGDDAEYLTAPYREPWRGRDAIVAGWIDRKDEPGEWSFDWDVIGVDGRRGFVQGTTTYGSEGDYANLWVIDLEEDGRASRFVEWWMEVDT